MPASYCSVSSFLPPRARQPHPQPTPRKPQCDHSSAKVIHWGQRKLFISELEFLTMFHKSGKSARCVCLCSCSPQRGGKYVVDVWTMRSLLCPPPACWDRVLLHFFFFFGGKPCKVRSTRMWSGRTGPAPSRCNFALQSLALAFCLLFCLFVLYPACPSLYSMMTPCVVLYVVLCVYFGRVLLLFNKIKIKKKGVRLSAVPAL